MLRKRLSEMQELTGRAPLPNTNKYLPGPQLWAGTPMSERDADALHPKTTQLM